MVKTQAAALDQSSNDLNTSMQDDRHSLGGGWVKSVAAAAALAAATMPTKAALYQDGYSDQAARDLASQFSLSVGRLSLYDSVYNFDVSGVYLNNNWYLTSAHALVNPYGNGPATITGLQQGSSLGGSLTPVMQSFIYPGYVNGGTTPDLALLYLGPDSSITAPSLTIGSTSPGQVVTSVGFGVYGSLAGGLSVQDGNARGWNAAVAPDTYGGYSPTYYNSAFFTPNGPSLNGRGLSGDSGSGVFNSSGHLVGINIASGGGATPIGSTEFLRLDHPEVFSWMNNTIQSVPEPSTYALLGLGAAALYAFGRRKRD